MNHIQKRNYPPLLEGNLFSGLLTFYSTTKFECLHFEETFLKILESKENISYEIVNTHILMSIFRFCVLIFHHTHKKCTNGMF